MKAAAEAAGFSNHRDHGMHELKEKMQAAAECKGHASQAEHTAASCAASTKKPAIRKKQAGRVKETTPHDRTPRCGTLLPHSLRSFGRATCLSTTQPPKRARPSPCGSDADPNGSSDGSSANAMPTEINEQLLSLCCGGHAPPGKAFDDG